MTKTETAERATLDRMLRGVVAVAPRCTGRSNGCQHPAVGVICSPAPDWGPVPGGYSCLRCAHNVLVEYRDKLGEQWFLAQPPEDQEPAPQPICIVPTTDENSSDGDGGRDDWTEI